MGAHNELEDYYFAEPKKQSKTAPNVTRVSARKPKLSVVTKRSKRSINVEPVDKVKAKAIAALSNRVSNLTPEMIVASEGLMRMVSWYAQTEARVKPLRRDQDAVTKWIRVNRDRRYADAWAKITAEFTHPKRRQHGGWWYDDTADQLVRTDSNGVEEVIGSTTFRNRYSKRATIEQTDKLVQPRGWEVIETFDEEGRVLTRKLGPKMLSHGMCSTEAVAGLLTLLEMAHGITPSDAGKRAHREIAERLSQQTYLGRIEGKLSPLQQWIVDRLNDGQEPTFEDAVAAAKAGQIEEVEFCEWNGPALKTSAKKPITKGDWRKKKYEANKASKEQSRQT